MNFRKFIFAVLLAGFLGISCASSKPAGTGWPIPMPGPLAEAGPRALLLPKSKSFMLKNGLRVVVVEHHRRPVVAIRLSFGSGSASDPIGAFGSSYFAVAALGDYSETKEDDTFRAKVWEQGGSWQFKVGPDDSMIGIDGYSADVENYLNMLGAAVTKPRRGGALFTARRDQLIHALEDVEVNDEEAFFDLLGRTAFGVRHVYARPVFGSIEDLQRLGHEQVVTRQKAMVRPRGATLLIAGDVDADRAAGAADQAFGGWADNKPVPRAAPEASPLVAPASVLVIPRRPAHSMAACATRPLADVIGSEATLDVLASVLGGGMNSRLLSALRDQRALSYTAQAAIVRRRFARSLLVCTRVRPEESAQAVSVLLEVLEGMKARAPSGDELLRAKSLLQGELETEQEDVAGTVAAWMETMRVGDRGPPERRIAEVRAVTADQVQALAKQVLEPKSLQFLLAGDPAVAKKAIADNKLGRAEVVTSVR